MLFPGIVEQLPNNFVSALRNASLAALLLRAGVAINLQSLESKMISTLALAVIPFFIEAGVGEIGQGAKDGWSEGRMERIDSKSSTPPSYITMLKRSDSSTRSEAII
jgi:hypothetical protein